MSCILVGGTLGAGGLHGNESVATSPHGDNPPVLLQSPPQKMPDPEVVANRDSRYLSLDGRQRYELVVRSSRRLQVSQYLIQEGDSLWSIAAAHDTDTATLQELNPRIDPDLLQPEQTLQVAPGFRGVAHAVIAGDTLADLADTYSTSAEQIRQANGITATGHLQVDDLLLIPGTRQRQLRNMVVSRGDFVRNAAPAPQPSDPVRAAAPAPAAPTAAPAARAASSGWLWPITGGLITTEYNKWHFGLDIAVPSGTKAYAARGGTVVFSGWDGGYGYCVMLDHGDGSRTRYAHASSLLVRNGQTVEQGDPVILVGSTGNSTGPHLHFEIIVNGENRNPMAYLP